MLLCRRTLWSRLCILVRLHNKVRRTTQVQVYAVCSNPAQLLSYMEQTTPRLLGDAVVGFLCYQCIESDLSLAQVVEHISNLILLNSVHFIQSCDPKFNI